MTKRTARRAAWALFHPLRAHRAAAARRRWYRYPPRPPIEYRYREHFGPAPAFVDGEAPVDLGRPYELPPLRTPGQLDNILTAFREAEWAGRCRHVGPAGYLCTERTDLGPHDVHRSTAPSGEVFDVWALHDGELDEEPPLDNVEVEALHLAAGMCISRSPLLNAGDIAYTCTLDADHAGVHISRGPEGEVYDSWP